jgi:hypothetical protein
MGKLLLAFAAGVILTGLVFMLFERPPTPEVELNFPDSAVQTAVPDPIPQLSETPTVAIDIVEPAPPAEMVSAGSGLPDDLKRLATGTSEDIREKLSGWNDEELEALEQLVQTLTQPSPEMRDAEVLAAFVSRERLRRSLIASRADRPSSVPPIELPPEFNYLLTEDPSRIHEQIQREPVDPLWSYQMEANLRSFYSSHPQIAGKYGFPTINCRTDWCELAFVAYGMNRSREPSEQGAPPMRLISEFLSENTELSEQPWGDQLNSERFPSVRTEPGGTLFLWHLSRKAD